MINNSNIKTGNNAKIGSLQSLKYILALMIFHHHYFVNPQIVQFGAFPVSTFFILSGFLLTFGYADRIDNGDFEYKVYIFSMFITQNQLLTIL